MHQHKNAQYSRVFALAVISLFLFLVFVPVVEAIGVRPPRAQITFAPETRYDFSVTVINDKPFPIEVETRVEGILAQHVAIRKPIRIEARSSGTVPITIMTPPSIERPGRHTTYIFFTEKYLDTASGTISTRTEVGFSLVLWQPYPGSYAEIVASAPSIPEGQDTALKVLINNLGTEPVVDGRATVRVLAADGALQDVFTFPNVAVPGDSNKDYYDIIQSSGYNPGKYTLEARLEYGLNVSESTSSFAVGTRDIDILALEGPVYLDRPVNRLTAHIESLWNEPLENVYATIYLGSAQVRTSPLSLNAFGRGGLTGYWETDSSVEPGQVLVRVNVTFPGGSREELLPLLVENATPQPPQYEEPASGIIELSAADIAMLLLLLVALILVGIWGAGKLRERHDSPSEGVAQGKTKSTSTVVSSESSSSESSSSRLPGPPKKP